jgi:hypothetical protein
VVLLKNKSKRFLVPRIICCVRPLFKVPSQVSEKKRGVPFLSFPQSSTLNARSVWFFVIDPTRSPNLCSLLIAR